MIKTMNEIRKFQKTVEDFKCEHCDKLIKGSGYTDHCPHCLYSKHVDKNPGDRQEDCEGMMKPIGAKITSKGYKIYYQCKNCGIKKSVKADSEDDFDKLLELSTKPIKED
jgi:hypothetical protein